MIRVAKRWNDYSFALNLSGRNMRSIELNKQK